MEGSKIQSEASIAEGLVKRIVTGDQQAETEMVERYQNALLAMLINKSRDQHLSEDVAQETWLLVLEKIRNQKLRNQKKLASFIIQIGKNQLIMKYRGRKRHTHISHDDTYELADENPSPEQRMQNKQFGRAVKEMLSGLKIERDRELLRRFYLVGDEKSDLCKEWDIDPAHFDRVIYRARERFKLVWAKKGGDTATK